MKFRNQWVKATQEETTSINNIVLINQGLPNES
jgi:hypothetical protein